MLLIKVISITNKENVTSYLNHLRKEIKCKIQFNQFCAYNRIEIKMYCRKRVRAKNNSCDTIWKAVSSEDVAVTVHFWREFSLSSKKNYKPVLVYEVNSLKPVAKIYFLFNLKLWKSFTLHEFWHIFFHNSTTNQQY